MLVRFLVCLVESFELKLFLVEGQSFLAQSGFADTKGKVGMYLSYLILDGKALI